MIRVSNVDKQLENILVTGGAGFIGSNFIRYMFFNTDFSGRIVNVDKLTYAGNLNNLIDIDKKYKGSRYFFEKADIIDRDKMSQLISSYDIDTVVHFAAESHVDRSIFGPEDFINTNIIGTFSLLEAVRENWKGKKDVLFHHISTDEVYGSLDEAGYFFEDTPYSPRSPYSASKASSDHLVLSYYHTYGLPVTISNCSNNYGPYQFPEKLIPLMILNIIEGKELPVYGKGENIRDWLYVDDHCSGIYSILKKGTNGETYNIGGDNEWRNIDIVNFLCEKIAEKKGKPEDFYKKQITFVRDRAGHDFRYAVNCERIKKELGWGQSVDFNEGIERTINWYLNNHSWVDSVRSGEYREWITRNY